MTTELISPTVTDLLEQSETSSKPQVEKPNSTSPVPVSKDTKFQKGQSGNPLGRPKGSKNKITLLKLSLEQGLREDAAPHMRDVLYKAIAMAKKGHPGMIKLLLELHMSKSGDVDDRATDDKITINIATMAPETPDARVVATQQSPKRELSEEE